MVGIFPESSLAVAVDVDGTYNKEKNNQKSDNGSDNEEYFCCWGKGFIIIKRTDSSGVFPRKIAFYTVVAVIEGIGAQRGVHIVGEGFSFKSECNCGKIFFYTVQRGVVVG